MLESFLARLLWTRQESENTSTIFSDAVRIRFLLKKNPASYHIRCLPEGIMLHYM